jgi:hypothetical protein
MAVCERFGELKRIELVKTGLKEETLSILC